MVSSEIDEFCGSPFWNESLTWNTEDPDLTPCFQKTVLVWTPCLFIWIFSSVELYYIHHSKYKSVPWSTLNVAKLFVTSVLIVLTTTELALAIFHKHQGSLNVHTVDICTPAVETLTFVLSATLLLYNLKHGIRTSGLQFLFWLLFSILGTVQLRTEVRKAIKDPSNISNTAYFLFYPLVMLMFILNCFADVPPTYCEWPRPENPCPDDSSSFPSRLTFSWFDGLAWKGFWNPLEATDLWDMKHEDAANRVVAEFDKYWKADLDKARSKKSTASVLPAMCYAFGHTFMFGTAFKLVYDMLVFVSPQLLSLLINFVQNKDQQWKGYLYAIALFVTATVQTIILSQYFVRMLFVGIRIRTALVAAIYRKSLKMSSASRKESTVGEIVNLMSVDAQKLVELTPYINMIWSAPLQIMVALYFLWNVLGPSVLAGLAVMLIVIPINGFMMNRQEVLQMRQMENKDRRVKLMNEMLSGIRILKLYAWEPSFEAQILKIRSEEIKVLKQMAYLTSGTSFIWASTPFLVSLVTFATYVMVDETNVLDANKAFVSLSLFNILSFPLSALPATISSIVQASVSSKRINRFMNCEELDPNNVEHDLSESAPIVVEGGNFHWDGEPILQDINLRFEKHRLSAVVGIVGSGKSSLICALLGEMNKTSGRVNTIGSIAYVPQQAWIQNATLRDNITFGKRFNRDAYEKIVEACALKPDFEMLPAGDQTEIGEKGINLSGGQKQRVSLARAVYSNTDLYLMDDPLSAVDSHVGKHIFENVLGPHGLLKNKTRVLVTHGVTYLRDVDKIIVLKDGFISEQGTYQELFDRKGAFAEFLIQYRNESCDKDEDVDELQHQLDGQTARQISRTTSHTSGTGSDLVQEQSPVDGAEKCATGEKLIEAENIETGNVKWKVYKHYVKSMGIFFTVATVLLNVVFEVFTIASSIWLTIWSEDKNVIVNGRVDTVKRDMYLSVYGLLGLGQAFGAYLADLAPRLGCWYAARALHTSLLRGILRAPLSFFDVTPSGRILTRSSRDVDILDTEMPSDIGDGAYCFFEVLATFFVISYTTRIFLLVIIPIGVVYYIIQRFYVATSRQLRRLDSVSRSPIYSHFGETVTGALVIRAYHEEERFIEESEAKVDSNQMCYYPTIIANRWLAVRLEMVGNLIILFSALFAVMARHESPGLVGLSVSYALQITNMLNWLVRMSTEVETNIVAVERIKEYSGTQPEADWNIPDKDPSPSWPDVGTVQFRDYALRYRPGLDMVLKGLNFSVSGGEKVGIVGRTGAGKSSLTLALFRIIEAAEGEITVDGIEISKIGLHALRSRLTIIPQDAVLFSGSLRSNMDPFEKRSDEEVWRALQHAHLKDFVKGLPAGLNHEITEGGGNLSVGQRQLICLGRALLRKTKVLILDEATAAVDLETDDLIQRTIRSEFKNCTILTIAHRLNTIMDSDRVIVLDRGTITEFDSPSVLLQNKQSMFYGMAKDAGLV